MATTCSLFLLFQPHAPRPPDGLSVDAVQVSKETLGIDMIDGLTVGSPSVMDAVAATASIELQLANRGTSCNRSSGDRPGKGKSR